MKGTGHRLDTEARGIPAADGTRVLATAPWTTSRAKARRERQSRQAMLDRHGLGADIVYMPKAVVTGSTPRLKVKGAPALKVYIDPNRMHKRIGPTNNGNPDA
jgi:hypothetical protein